MRPSTGESIAIGVVIGLLVLFLVGLIAGVSALLLMWAWNLLMPLIWTGAPHLGFWHAVAAGILIGTVRGIIQFSTTVNKSKS